MRREVKCPRCGQPAIYAPENQFRPFCSERCQMIDLGQWAEGKYAIPITEDKSSSIEATHNEEDDVE